jgi:general stress protein CsbA
MFSLTTNRLILTILQIIHQYAKIHGEKFISFFIIFLDTNLGILSE